MRMADGPKCSAKRLSVKNKCSRQAEIGAAKRSAQYSNVPLKELEKEQREKLIPKKPLKIEKVNLKHIQDLTSKEQQTPVRREVKTKVKSSQNAPDSLEKLLHDQEEQEKKIKTKKNTSGIISKKIKTNLKNVQELSPEEKAVPTKSDAKKKL